MPKQQTVPRTTQSIRKAVIYGVLAIAISLYLLFSLVHRSALFVDATTHKPETYTELYFVNPTKLPTVFGSGFSLPVSFVVHNVEGRSLNYTYDIDFTTDLSQTTVLASHSLLLASNASHTITNNVRLPNYTGRAEVSVLLIHQNQAIHFWIEVKS